MPVSMYRISVPVFLRGFAALSDLLRKGEAHARESGRDPDTLAATRLVPDMLPLSGQIQRASDTSKLALSRLTGSPAPKMEDNETSFAELHARIDATVAYLNGFKEADLEGSQSRIIRLDFGAFKPVFRGDDYLLSFTLPNFYFHVTTAYDILRHEGVSIGKQDFLGPYES